jgi:hypothetical protein
MVEGAILHHHYNDVLDARFVRLGQTLVARRGE